MITYDGVKRMINKPKPLQNNKRLTNKQQREPQMERVLGTITNSILNYKIPITDLQNYKKIKNYKKIQIYK
jgi:hypothetical protein